MGPSTSVDGEPNAAAPVPTAIAASMGPSTSVDGELTLDPLTRPARHGFNGAVDKRRRRAERASAKRSGPRCFNGAVDKRRRRGVAYLALDEALRLASMGPSTSVDGEVEAVPTFARFAWLQWGRRQASTERDLVGLLVVLGSRASMGPSTSVDGEITPPAPESSCAFKLQWGRRQASTES